MFKDKRVLVTGGTGLIGRQVIKLLCGQGAMVTSVSLDNIKLEYPAEYIQGDLTNLTFCRYVIDGTDYMFHLAGVKGSVDVTRKCPASFMIPMLMMNTNVLEASRQAGVKGLVFTSSIGAYPDREILDESMAFDGEPMDYYPGWAKRTAELQIKAYQIQYGIDNFIPVRLSTVYGEGDNFDPDNAMVIPSLMAKIKRGDNPVIIWGDDSAIRDFAYSEDIAKGLLLAMEKGHGLFNLGSGEGYSIKELVETLCSVVHFNYLWDAAKPSGQKKRILNIDRARLLLNYNPQISLVDGLRKTWDWYCQHEDEFKARQNYFVSTTGNVSSETIRKYIEVQATI